MECRGIRRIEGEGDRFDAPIAATAVDLLEESARRPAIGDQSVAAMLDVIHPFADADRRVSARGLAFVRLDEPELDGDCGRKRGAHHARTQQHHCDSHASELTPPRVDSGPRAPSLQHSCRPRDELHE